MFGKLPFAVLALLISSTSHATLLFTIDTYTTDQLSFTLGGTFDADTIGDQPQWLAIKNDWTNNVGVHTEFHSGLPIIDSNTIQIGGLAVDTFRLNTNFTYTDSVFFRLPNSSATILAGTAVSGSLTLLGLNAFDPADAATLELISGFNNGNGGAWARFEARAQPLSSVPVPAAVWLFGTALIGLVGFGKRRKTV
jgi:hypothetical protein